MNCYLRLFGVLYMLYARRLVSDRENMHQNNKLTRENIWLEEEEEEKCEKNGGTIYSLYARYSHLQTNRVISDEEIAMQRI